MTTARRVKIELTEAMKEKRAIGISMFREKAQIQLKSIKSEIARARVDEEKMKKTASWPWT